MASQEVEVSTVPRIWRCDWNWCPETFRDSRDLGKHLQETHFNNIRKVKKRDWDAYLRSTESRSGVIDSPLAAVVPDPARSMQSLSQNSMEVYGPPRRSPSGSIPPHRSTSGSVRHRSPLPPLPENNHLTSAEIRAEPQHSRTIFNVYPSPGETRQTNSSSSSSSSSQLTGSDTKRHLMPFASYSSQSLSMPTPSVTSPSLTNTVAGAITRSGQNEASPSVRPHSQSQSYKLASPSAGVPPFQRRTSLGQSPLAHKPHSYLSRLTQTSSFYPPSQSRASPAKASSADSPGEALTQNFLSPASSRLPHNSSQRSGASSSVSSPRTHTQPPQPSPHSFGGSHATRSYPQTQRLPDTPAKTEPLPGVKPVIKHKHELEYPHSQFSSPTKAPAALAPKQLSPPRTRRRRARSKTPAQPAPTRTLRSQSRSQTTAPAPLLAAAQSTSLRPLPRTRSHGGQTNADVTLPPTAAAAGTTATSSTIVPQGSAGRRSRIRLADTQAPRANARGTLACTNPNTILGRLAAVDEQPHGASRPVAMQPQLQIQTQTQAQRPPTFRSGTLQIPRCVIQAPRALIQSQSQSQTQAQMAAAVTGRGGESEAQAAERGASLRSQDKA